MKFWIRRWQIAAMAGILLLGAGCTTGRGILDVSIPSSTNFQLKVPVRILRVTDQRVFALNPKKPSIPSLMDGRISDEAITARAVARKESGKGEPMGDILLPKGRTVAHLVREAMEKALRDKGYYIVGPSEKIEPAPLPVEVDIQQFWSWLTPGSWTNLLEFEGVITIRSPVLGGDGTDTIRGHILLHTFAATTKAWMTVISKGIDSLVAGIKKAVKTPDPQALAGPGAVSPAEGKPVQQPEAQTAYEPPANPNQELSY
jgi:hypothetical protein